MYNLKILVFAVSFIVTLGAAQLIHFGPDLKMKNVYYGSYTNSDSRRLFFSSFCCGKGTNSRTLFPGAPDPDLMKYEIVQPVFQHARTKRDTPSQGRDESGSYPREDTIKINDYLVDIRMNLDLLAENFVISYQKNGRTINQKPENEVNEFCYYGGTVRGKPNSWVAVSTCHGVEGAIYDGDKLKYIQPVQGSATYEHHLYEHDDWSQPFQCAPSSATNHVHHNTSHARNKTSHVRHNTNHVRHNTDHVLRKFRKIGFSKDQEKQTSDDHRYKKQAPDFMKMDDKKPHLENEPWRYIEQVLVADNSVFEANNRDLYSVSHKMKSLINVVNGFYIPLNISIILVGVVVWNEKDKVTISGDAATTLDNFKVYRTKKLVKDIPNDNAFLITGKKFKKDDITGHVGIAYFRTMCSSSASCGLVTNATMSGPLALTVAHEIGYNLGMNLDIVNIPEPICKCPDETCIMYPSTAMSASRPVHWSLCSLNDLKRGFSQGLDYCLRNKPKRLIKFSVCGNGFVEAGEQCDCGTVRDPRAANLCHQCCDPKTCKLRANATCGAGQCCDLQTCRPKSANTVCRSAKSECDLPEYCTGESGNCPDDVHKMDTTSCGQGEQAAYCVRGECHSHTDQCRLIWGAASKTCNAEEYDSLNKKMGIDIGCGYDVINGEAKQCRLQDTMCGRLYCKCAGVCGPPLVQYFHKAYRAYTYDFLNVESNSVVIDMGLSVVDPGLVPDGAICGQNKMCLNQECVSVTEYRAKNVNNKTLPCPSDCSGHGICNFGQCDCERGYVPPLEIIDMNDYESTINDPIRFPETVSTTGPLQLHNNMVMFYVCFVLAVLGLVVGLIYYFRKSEKLRNLFRS